jgi:hypothetical protein
MGDDRCREISERTDIRIPLEAASENEYLWRPLRGEASFLFPPARKKEEALVYHIEGLIPLSAWITSESEPAALGTMVERIRAAATQFENFLIAEERIAWNAEKIYWHAAREKVLFLYLPSGSPDGEPSCESDFWRELSHSLLVKAVAEGWKKENLLLFLVRLSQWAERPEEGRWIELHRTFEETAQSETIRPEEEEEARPKRKKFVPFLPRS